MATYCRHPYSTAFAIFLHQSVLWWVNSAEHRRSIFGEPRSIVSCGRNKARISITRPVFEKELNGLHGFRMLLVVIFPVRRDAERNCYGIWGEPVWRLFAIQSVCGRPQEARAFSSFSTSYSTRRIVGLGPSNKR